MNTCRTQIRRSGMVGRTRAQGAVIAVGMALAMFAGAEAVAKSEAGSRAGGAVVGRADIALIVQNLIGKYEFYHFANMYEDERYLYLFANGDADLKIQTSRGIWQGPDAARRILKYYATATGSEGFAGQMHLHPLSTPVIEVAGDGQTARGVWLSDGIEAGVRDGAPNGANLWLKYCADFKKLNGTWKIWHLNTYPIFMQQYGKPWQSDGPPGPPPGAGTSPRSNPAREQIKADRGNNNVGTMYTPGTVQTLEPEPPTPYETWNDSMSCIK